MAYPQPHYHISWLSRYVRHRWFQNLRDSRRPCDPPTCHSQVPRFTRFLIEHNTSCVDPHTSHTTHSPGVVCGVAPGGRRPTLPPLPAPHSSHFQPAGWTRAATIFGHFLPFGAWQSAQTQSPWHFTCRRKHLPSVCSQIDHRSSARIHAPAIGVLPLTRAGGSPARSGLGL